MNNVIGIDIGGTKIMAGYFQDGNFQKPEKTFFIPTDAQEGLEKVLENLILSIEKLRDKDTKSIGIAWAGFIDSKKGIIKKSPNMPGFKNFEIIKFIKEKTGLPVFIENDARLFALAEREIFAPKDAVFLGIILGTGVGSGLILNGEIVSGSQNFAGEIGHQILCSENISAEDLFSGPNLEKLLGEDLIEITKKMQEDLDFKKEIHTKMTPRIDQFSRWIYNLTLTLNPEKIVLGGSVGINFWPSFFDEIYQKVNEKINEKNLPINFKIEKSKLENAGLIGAAILADKNSI